MSISAYAGEFTISPIPLEMSMNYCSHKCAVCFANLNQPGRTLDVKATINQIKNCNKGKGLTSYLLREKYPILLSNRVDPFAKTNYRQTLSFIELFNANENKIVFQTRGGDGIDEALSLLDYKTHWYVSISQLNDDLRKKLEPGAPTIQSRFELIEKLLSKGHSVSVGINPLVEEWLPVADFQEMVDRLLDMGVKGYWLELIHLNAKQVGNMSEKEKLAVGSSLIKEAAKRTPNYSYIDWAREYIQDSGGEVFSINQPNASSFFDDYHKKFKTIKTNQDFINHCFKKYPNGGEIKWHEYYEFMKEPFYEQEFSEADGFVYRIARNVYKKLENTPFKTLKGVLEAYWDNIDIPKSLFNNDLFSVLSYGSDKKPGTYRCKEDSKIIYWFNAEPSDKLRHFIE
ncbi:MAG: hypothetical protein KF862_07280 [Chitinophagaceae bacterium]|nr:hypothetical protein [Chitinophagaceae bacterium]